MLLVLLHRNNESLGSRGYMGLAAPDDGGLVGRKRKHQCGRGCRRPVEGVEKVKPNRRIQKRECPPCERDGCGNEELGPVIRGNDSSEAVDSEAMASLLPTATNSFRRVDSLIQWWLLLEPEERML
jgi:hypothetical protein